MKAYLWLLALAQAAPSPAPTTPPPGPVELQQGSGAGPEPYPGSWRNGMAELERHVRAGELEPALALADGLLAAGVGGGWRTRLESATNGWSERLLAPLERPLASIGLETATSVDRAEVHYARGYVLQLLERTGDAREALDQARNLAGPGRTRLDAIYDLGTSHLLEAEAWRAQIPEVAGQGATPPATAGAASGDSEEDPLERARAAYLAAREHYIERLRADWTDEAARANTDLVLRRLRQLDALQKEREEQAQQQEQQQDQSQDQEGEQTQDQKGGQGDSQAPQPEEQQPEPKPEEEQEPKPEEEPKESEAEQAEEPQGEQGSEEQQDAKEPPQTEPPEERQLTKEEVQRLLERLSQHEEEGEAVRERLRRMRRVPVKRDW